MNLNFKKYGYDLVLEGSYLNNQLDFVQMKGYFLFKKGYGYYILTFHENLANDLSHMGVKIKEDDLMSQIITYDPKRHNHIVQKLKECDPHSAKILEREIKLKDLLGIKKDEKNSPF